MFVIVCVTIKLLRMLVSIQGQKKLFPFNIKNVRFYNICCGIF